MDIARAVEGAAPAPAPLLRWGLITRLAALLDRRLREAGVTDNDAVILAAAGSSDPTAAQNVEELAGQLRALRSNRIVAAYGSSAKPSVPEAVAMLREEAAGGAGAGESAGAVDLGGRVVIAAYLLAPGFFHDQLAKAGADLVTAATAAVTGARGNCPGTLRRRPRGRHLNRLRQRRRDGPGGRRNSAPDIHSGSATSRLADAS